ncbi:P1 family peptidase [Clostridium sp. DL1XJH146]
MKEIDIREIENFKIGSAEYEEGITGCTVILCSEGASGGVDVRGGAPGTRETDLLNPINLVDKVHGVLLAGGSAFGLDAAAGVMTFLEERNIGFDVGVTKVPIVCGAALFDLNIGNHKIRPDKKLGYEACVNSDKNNFENGNSGAGKGTTVGKILGPKFSMKGGLGTYAIQVGDLKIGAIVAVNCLGDVFDTDEGKVIAGVLNGEKNKIMSTQHIMLEKYNENKNLFNGNTTIGAIITNAKLSKAEANKVSSVAHNGYAKAINPVHTMFDGDTIFTMASGIVDADVNTVSMLSVEVMKKAIVRGVKAAKTVGECLAYRDLFYSNK